MQYFIKNVYNLTPSVGKADNSHEEGDMHSKQFYTVLGAGAERFVVPY